MSLFLLLLLLSDFIYGICFAKDQPAALLSMLRLCEWVFVGYMIQSFSWTKKKVQLLSLIISLQLFFICLLTGLQFFTQHSLGGIWYFFGERMFTSQTPGIADASLNGQLVLRPYATFPHPNVLAGYLITLMSFLCYFISQILEKKKKKRKEYFSLAIFVALVILGTGALFLTLSRVAIFVWCLISLGFLMLMFLRNRGKHLRTLPIALFTLLLIITLPFLGHRFFDSGAYTESFSIRSDLTIASLKMIQEHALFGVGGYNFLPNLPHYLPFISFSLLQPVHNIFLLIASEYGLIGLALFFYFLTKAYAHIKRKGVSTSVFHKPFLYLLFFLPLILGSTDHYFLTLEQGQFLFAICFGFCLSSMPKVKL